MKFPFGGGKERGGTSAGQGSEVSRGLGSSVVKTVEQLTSERIANAANAYASMPCVGDELRTKIGQQFKNPDEAATVFEQAMGVRAAKAAAKPGQPGSNIQG